MRETFEHPFLLMAVGCLKKERGFVLIIKIPFLVIYLISGMKFSF